MNDLASILADLSGLLQPGADDPERAREDLEARKRREAADRRETRRQCLLARHVPAKAAAIIAADLLTETEAVQVVRGRPSSPRSSSAGGPALSSSSQDSAT